MEADQTIVSGERSLPQQWSKAIVEYQRALAEFPDDLTALVSLGMAYLESRQLNFFHAH